ncbi:MAG: PilC/PilY family type IV pilus protein [bacterium]|nr:hypothetical protein [Gammaproteobacteria bacterium]
MAVRHFRLLILCTFFALVSSFSVADDINLAEDFAGTVLHDLDPHCGGSCVDADLVIVGTTGDAGTVNASINVTTGNLELTSNANLSGTEIVSVGDGVGVFAVTVHVVSVNDPPVYLNTFVTPSPNLNEGDGDININLVDAFQDADLINPQDDLLTYRLTITDTPDEFLATLMINASGFGAGVTIISDDDDGSTVPRTLVVETTNPSISLDVYEDAHGKVDVTVRATDAGRPPEVPASAIPLFDEGSFSVTYEGVGDDTPVAKDDHYDEIPALEINEDSDEIVFNVIANDETGDSPTVVVSVGKTIVTEDNVIHTWRTTSRIYDPEGLGQVTAINGEVSCAFNDPGAGVDCISTQTADTTVNGAAAGISEIVYKPGENFNGEDQFVYCIQDSFPGNELEPIITEPREDDIRCATVTVNVLPVNDLPTADSVITYIMESGDDLAISVDQGLRLHVQDIDNTQLDGFGCDPLDSNCTSSGDTLYFNLPNGNITEFGQIELFTSEGAFVYSPDNDFTGYDSFDFEVCDLDTTAEVGHCAAGIVTIQVIPQTGADDGSTDGLVEFDYQLSESPLELPVGPEPNLLIVNDDSGSMEWEVTTQTGSQYSGYELVTGQDFLYLYEFSKGLYGAYYVAPPEVDSPGFGFWRLRSAEYNSIYYDPQTRYDPWKGTNGVGDPYPQIDPANALHEPNGSQESDLTVGYDYTAQGYKSVFACTPICLIRYFGFCIKFGPEECSTTLQFTNIEVDGLYIPRYYNWIDRNGDGEMSAEPSPADQAGLNCNNLDATADDADCSEGQLVEIRNDGTVFPKTVNRSDCAADPCSYEEELNNFANWFSYSRRRQTITKSAIGKVISGTTNLRIGYATINKQSVTKEITNEDGVSETVPVVPQPIRSMNTSTTSGPKKDLLDAIYLATTGGGTPLRQALQGAGRHFECVADDIYGSTIDSSPGDEGCPVSVAPAGNCQQNFTLLITDGFWNGNKFKGTETFIGDADSNNDTNFDGGAFAGSSRRDTLADVAMHYYERDLHTGLDNEVPTTAIDRDLASTMAFVNSSNDLMHQHMITYTLGLGVRGVIGNELLNPVQDPPTSYQDPFDWGDPLASDARKVDDVQHAAYNGRGIYLDASNATELTGRLDRAFAQFSSGSGSASAASFNSQEILANTQIYRALYNTKTNVGDLVAHTFTTLGAGEQLWSSAELLDEVSATNREIITYNPDSKTGIPFRPESLTLIQRLVFSGEESPADDAEIARRVNYLRGDNAFESPQGDLRERPVVKGRLGDIIHSSPVYIGEPDRLGRDTAPYPLNEDSYTSFKVDPTGLGGLRDEVVYVSANDGMLHGFLVACHQDSCKEPGSEVFGYMPNSLILGTFSRNITELLNTSYSHKYFVDLSPALNDVFLDPSGLGGSKEWITMLMGGHGAGAKAYFALNVTDPNLLNEANAGSAVLWEFTDEDDSYPTDQQGLPLTDENGLQRLDLQISPQPVKDLGYSFSVPTMAMSNVKDGPEDDAENEWVAIIGNGYNSTAGIAKLFVMFLDRGVDGYWCHPDKIHNVGLNGSVPGQCSASEQDFVKLDTGFGTLPVVHDADGEYLGGGFPNGLGTPRGIDVDGNGTLDFAYAGDTQGNFFRFDLSSDDFHDWNVTKIFKATYQGVDQPITTQPIVARHPTEPDGFIVIFATGSYITTPDGYSTDIQSIYGIWDELIEDDFIEPSEIVQQNYTNVFSESFGNVRTLSNNAVDYTPATPKNPDGGKKGWFNHLDIAAAGSLTGEPEFPGERAIRNIQLRGDLAFVNSIIPRSNVNCVDIAGGFALAFCPGTGGLECLDGNEIFDVNNDGEFDEDDNITGNQVAGIRFEDAVPADSTFMQDRRITQLSDETIVNIKTNTNKAPHTGRLSWKQLDSF